ncbi:MAG: translation initiation factor IF-3 [Deltaproteobacteria bacterium RIFCSPLOWO2_12_FULL_43_16]|nr:MAG: translation initiation factor IF-3 [Deltaproteobacteria bacterium GWA2_43_19]OGQ33947.1 MAG: translation initiation factor IF-3 [Deltaproteobacteria bacterium RIFCSPLOWO2_01_FULL_42_9]OGQ59922.1 MAG: translation initiation factor IF-3 [Deltaproteobacteria bacterium RIFCSPLOWO2_12_FULL_43_16]
MRILDHEGKQLGVMAARDGIKLAEETGLDLVEISPNAVPPVCKIMDYGKYKYQLSKKAHEAKKKQTVIHLKEVKMRSGTEEHDFNFKMRHIERFLADGDKAKVTIVFRGRELAHIDLGREVLNRVAEAIKGKGVIEQHPKMEGKSLTMVIAPAGK